VKNIGCNIILKLEVTVEPQIGMSRE